jgi:predicted unusual protein kinase regulating ubiquinone biosynthesis (AarF/ABC1/UbiB family)
MGISLKPEYLKRYRDIALLLFKYGNSDLVQNAGLEETLLSDEPRTVKEGQPKPEELANDLEALGPTFIKLGQLLSTRPDFLPAPYLLGLSRLQDNCEPFSFKDVENIIVSELGVRFSKAFSEFSTEPIAAASIGQIHRAKMRDGREVAVKVQRPGIRETVLQDLEILSEIADFYDKHTEAGKRYEFAGILDEFRRSLLAELDYRKEAQNLQTLKDNMSEFSLVVVPEPVNDYTSSKVLTMDFITGKKITAVSKLNQLDIDGSALAEEVFKAYLKQILVDGFFHADPHPGNVLLTKDNKVALVDLGMVARLTPRLQQKLLQLILAISEGRADAVANLAIEIGDPKDNFDQKKFRKEITDLVQGHLGKNIKEMDFGVVILGVTSAAGESAIRLPVELTMLGKTLLNLDQVGRTLDPDFNPNDSVQRNAARIMNQRMLKSISPGHFYTNVLEAKDFLEFLPGRFNKILDLVATNKLKVKVDSIDESMLVDAFQKVANRITLGLVLAALIMSASNLMKIPSPFTILGYPGLAIIFYILAATCGFGLVIHIALYDQKAQKYCK